MFEQQTKKLTFRAPRRESVLHEGGTFSTQAWTVEGVQFALSGGAWFGDAGDHDFFSREAATAAHMGS